MLTWLDFGCTPYGEGVSQVSAEAASVNQEAPPSMSTHLDNTGVVTQFRSIIRVPAF